MLRRTHLYFPLILLFILGCRDGYLALWKQGQPDPVRIFPYSITSLPDADQKAVKKGIPLESREDLLRLLEDYLS